ncbi:hypothetical protein KR067_008725, partial [Drosophila pandora]
ANMIQYLFIIHLALLPLVVVGDPSNRAFLDVKAPWQVSIRIDGNPKCSGAVFSPLYILTAASCVSGNHISKIKVRAGSNYRCWTTPISTAKVIIHEKYVPGKYTDNLALLKLEKPLELSKSIQETPLAEAVPKDNSLATVAIWDLLLVIYHTSIIDETVISKQKCSKELKSSDNNAWVAAIATETICARAKGQGACVIDIGAPLIAGGHLAGILTYPSCSSKPDIYMNLVEYKSWLETNT